MIYLNNTTEEQEVFLPIIERKGANATYTLRLRSTMTGEAVLDDILVEDLNRFADYYEFVLTLPSPIATGTYRLDVLQAVRLSARCSRRWKRQSISSKIIMI